jgi:hypothetical protein
VFERFRSVDLSPDEVSNHDMGHIFEDLIRRFSEQSNETAGEHFTPREVIRLMVNVLFAGDDDFLAKNGPSERLIYGIFIEIAPWPCPLTLLEQWLESKAGATVHSARIYRPRTTSAAKTAAISSAIAAPGDICT